MGGSLQNHHRRHAFIVADLQVIPCKRRRGTVEQVNRCQADSSEAKSNTMAAAEFSPQSAMNVVAAEIMEMQRRMLPTPSLDGTRGQAFPARLSCPDAKPEQAVDRGRWGDAHRSQNRDLGHQAALFRKV